ncbi:DUF998 domain-containing protein [Umezawaea sp. Da 62-37]|uniref:DUF998 domain-containing protein n=1 Tax=Umezawaea sp. Da 62-37 TaxID=3075927 RepID=UPI0028F6DBF5|nr:DUF998 domain-containing protein [Umezawaea sp. Da 62-37]WNV81892.1 DUF998 domain-containing protein [Umezawaea sp. Da 62-37]
MDDVVRPGRGHLWWAGLVAVLTGVQYVVLEAVAASAWVDPPYRYAFNYISDLGVPGPRSDTGARVLNSPLAAVMNTAFVVQGVGLLLVALVVAAHLHGVRRYLLTAFAVCHAVGNVLVAVFHSTSPGGYHVVGAVLAIVGGNLLTLAASTRRWLVVLPVLGLVSALLIGRVGAGALDGLWERGSVYSITVWEVVFGALLLWRGGRCVDRLGAWENPTRYEP